jgi:hypothetical protein
MSMASSESSAGCAAFIVVERHTQQAQVRGDTRGDRMGHRECFEFGERNLPESDILGTDILEVGAHMDGGTMRPYVESFHPRRYMGIDIQTGPGVDMVCDVKDLLTRLGTESFDVLIANELMEHIRD